MHSSPRIRVQRSQMSLFDGNGSKGGWRLASLQMNGQGEAWGTPEQKEMTGIFWITIFAFNITNGSALIHFPLMEKKKTSWGFWFEVVGRAKKQRFTLVKPELLNDGQKIQNLWDQRAKLPISRYNTTFSLYLAVYCLSITCFIFLFFLYFNFLCGWGKKKPLLPSLCKIVH